MEIASAQMIREAEQELFRSGEMTSSALMARVVYRMAARLSSEAEGWGAAGSWHPEAVLLYLGKGNNAGDAAGLATELGLPVYVRRPAGTDFAEDTVSYLQQAAEEVDVHILTDESTLPTERDLLIVDGLLGSGAQGELRPAYAALVQEMNTLRAHRPHSLLLAIDIPTGLHADTGAVGATAVRADITAVVGCVKPGMLADGAEDYVGRLLCIPLPEVELPADPHAPQVLDEETLHAWLPRRAYSCFKNRAGRVDIVAGSVGYTGAARLCAEAAVAAGAGLVALYCPKEIYPVLAAAVTPEVMVRPVASYAEVPRSGAQALVLGPGLGSPGEAESQALRELASHFEGPVVLDADGLNLATAHGWELPPNAVLTPHPGEMRRLFPAGATLTRAECARLFVQQNPCTLLLKGARTLITDGETTYYNSTGGPYMANGGQGDTLAGVIGALLAQGMAPLPAAALAAYRCGQAAAWLHGQMNHPLAVPAARLITALPRFL